MLPEMFPYPAPADAPGLCQWHFVVRSHGMANTFATFLAWQDAKLQARYCTEWTHHDPEILWRWTLGEAFTMREQRCNKRGQCLVEALAERAQLAPPVYSRDAISRIRTLLDTTISPP